MIDPEPVTELSAPRALPGDRGLPPAGAARLAAPHLPQGAPTSPTLANLVCFRLDRRLAGLAATAGARYTRYVGRVGWAASLDPVLGERLHSLAARVDWS